MIDINDIYKSLSAEPYEDRGILNSEIALIIHTVLASGCVRIIESGRARGQSTYLLAKYLPFVSIESVELRGGHPDEAVAQSRLSELNNVSLHYGNGAELVPHLARQSPVTTAILLDGPKGAAAVGILEECFKLAHVAVGFIHDMRRLDHGEASPHRAAAIERLPLHRFSDDPALVAASSWMDAEVVKAGGPCGPSHEATYGSYGPTLGVFANHIIRN